MFGQQDSRLGSIKLRVTDIPAHSYTYTFEPNPRWTRFYAGGREIQNYLERTCEKYGVNRFIKCGHQVTRCQWAKAENKWYVSYSQCFCLWPENADAGVRKLHIQEVLTGKTFEDEADVVISARGAFNDYAWPDIKGLRSFRGKIVHSASWDAK